jgi:hypothetical protein
MTSRLRIASATLAGIVLFAGSPARAQSVPTGFPLRCEPGQVEVMLLGTYHFAGSSGDAVSTPADDILSPLRQRELDELVARLAPWAPQQVAVEWPYHFADSTAARYARWRSPEGYPSRNEVAQVGFRLAARLGHARVYPIDFAMRIDNDSLAPLFAREPRFAARSDSLMAVLRAASAADAAAHRARSITEQLRVANSEARLRGGNSLGMFGAMLPAGDGDNLAGPQLLARWYERNFVMAHYLTRIVEPSTTRVLLLVGSGHVPALRNILDESPAFCPVSPLALLQ